MANQVYPIEVEALKIVKVFFKAIVSSTDSSGCCNIHFHFNERELQMVKDFLRSLDNV
jgi:hypothetical protein